MQDIITLYVTGINKDDNMYQIYNFFKDINSNVIAVDPQGLSLDNKSQIVKVYVNNTKDAEDIIETINFIEKDGNTMRAHIENEESAKARFNESANVCIKFDDYLDVPKERDLYEMMRYFGKVLSVKVLPKQKLCFCQFFNQEDADRVCENKYYLGMTFSKKTPKRTQAPKPIQIRNPTRKIPLLLTVP